MPARAKLPPGKGKRVPLNMRTTQEVRDRLEKNAADSGRSLVQEVEYQLDRAFLVQDHLAFISGDHRTADFVRTLVEVQKLIETYQGQSVWDDFESHEAMKSALEGLLAQRVPKPSTKFQKRLASYERYKEKKLKPWLERGGGYPFNNPDAGPRPVLKPSPKEQARGVGRAAANVVRESRHKALVDALAAHTHEEN